MKTGRNCSVLFQVGLMFLLLAVLCAAPAVTRGADNDNDSRSRQAIWSAEARIDLSRLPVDFARGALAGIEALPERQYLYVEGAVRDVENPRFDEPVRLLLSKSVYPAEDLHLDAVVWLSPGADEETAANEHLELLLRDTRGRELARGVISDPPETGVFFSMGLPPELNGAQGELEARWILDGEERGSAIRSFDVAAPAGTAQRGRIPLRIPNDSGAAIENASFTVGAPFPHGALYEERHVRLVDETGREIPLQTRVTARWSRFGPIKWLLCDFTTDLNGKPRDLFLEHGPEIERGAPPRRGWFAGCRRSPAPEPTRRNPIRILNEDHGFPKIEAGRLRISEDGVFYDVEGNGNHTKFMAGEALMGEYVAHEDGRRYGVPVDVRHSIEEHGSEKVVVRRTGWYRAPDGAEFCNFVTRLVFHRDSPLIRISHTWIFTGDSNRDRIREMGWRFPLADGFDDGRFLNAEDGTWQEGEWLVQWNHDAFDVATGGERHEFAGGRSPGVAAIRRDDGTTVYFGAKDFWQNFPSELNVEGNTFTFLNWPRNNREPYSERPVPAGEAYRHRFAHEGNLLDFRLPEEYGMVEGELGEIARLGSMDGRRLNELGYDPEDLASANAQGIARTEEFYIVLAGARIDSGEAARVLTGLNSETLRAVVDPVWVSASGAFGRIHHRDVENYAAEEQAYLNVCRAPARWADRLEIYGKWIFGDIAAWRMDLPAQEATLYRAFRRNHHGWPFRWLPFARSGDPELLRYADRATRMMTNHGFRHYADDGVGGEQGWRHRGPLPWRGGSSRNYTVDCDYLWNAYYLTGFRRPRDVALIFGEVTQRADRIIPSVDRASQGMFYSYQHMYQATFQPWFLVASDAFAQLYLTQRNFYNDHWRPTGRLYLETTGSPAFHALYMDVFGEHEYRPGVRRTDAFNRAYHYHGGAWGQMWINDAAWRATRDPYYLGRISHYIDWMTASVYTGEPDYYQGIPITRFVDRTGPGQNTGGLIQEFPVGLGALAEAGYRPPAIPTYFAQHNIRKIQIRKEAGEAVPLFLRLHHPVDEEHTFTIERPDGRTVTSGTWSGSAPHELEIEAEAPAGIYTLRINPASWITVPVAPPEVPEVFHLSPQEDGTTALPSWMEGEYSQHWFHVPEGVTAFRLTIPVTEYLRRVTVWNPDNEPAVDVNFAPDLHEGDDPIVATVAVRPGHAGKRWRVTNPAARRGPLRLDPAIPPIFSVSREKWFDPR